MRSLLFAVAFCFAGISSAVAQVPDPACECEFYFDTFPQTTSVGTVSTTATCAPNGSATRCVISGTITFNYTGSGFVSGTWGGSTHGPHTISSPATGNNNYTPLDMPACNQGGGPIYVSAWIHINPGLGSALNAGKVWYCKPF